MEYALFIRWNLFFAGDKKKLILFQFVQGDSINNVPYENISLFNVKDFVRSVNTMIFVIVTGNSL